MMEVEPKDSCFICEKREYGFSDISENYDAYLYDILKELYGEKQLEDKSICNICILKMYQYKQLENINDKLEEIYMSI